jgi:thiol:disulfide interchange protein DsbA
MVRQIVLASLLLGAGMSGAVQAQTPVAGRDYTEVPNTETLERVEGKIVVEEFFNYICPACNAFEPYFVEWQQQLPDDVEVVHLPAAFRPDFEQYARAYFAAKTFGLVDKTHQAVYRAIHIEHRIPAEGDPIDLEKIADFYAGYGVDASEFLDVMQGFSADVKLRQTAQYMTRVRVSSTPSLVINGRYRVGGSTYDDMLRIADYLIDRERSRQSD